MTSEDSITISWTDRAQTAFDEVLRYISRRDSAAAVRLGDQLIQGVELLRDMPRLGRETDPQRGLRRLVVGQWTVVYRCEKQEVTIVVVAWGKTRPQDTTE